MRDLFKAAVNKKHDKIMPARISYSIFQVTDRTVAADLIEWEKKNYAAQQAIFEFVRETFCQAVMPLEVPFYTIGEDGALESVGFNGLYTPLGWEGVPDTHEQIPVSQEALAQVRALPRVPSYKEFHDLIAWPTMSGYLMSDEVKKAAYIVNRLVRALDDGNNVYVICPEPRNFEHSPQIYKAVQGWEPPEYLEFLREGAVRQRGFTL